MIYVDLAPIAVLIWTVVVRNGRWTTGSANGKLITDHNRTARLMKILFAAEVTSPCRYHYFWRVDLLWWISHIYYFTYYWAESL